MRDIAAIYDSYNCGIIWKFGHCRPWPTKRQGFRSPTAHEWYLLDKLLFHQVRGLRSNQELCCEGSEEEEMPGEMPTRGAQGLGILLNKLNQSQINFGKYQPVIGKLRHLQWGDTRWSADGLEKFNSTGDYLLNWLPSDLLSKFRTWWSKGQRTKNRSEIKLVSSFVSTWFWVLQAHWRQIINGALRTGLKVGCLEPAVM